MVLFCFLIQLLRFKKENCILEHKHGFGKEMHLRASGLTWIFSCRKHTVEQMQQKETESAAATHLEQ